MPSRRKTKEDLYAEKLAVEPCPSCGSIFGSDAVENARQELEAALESVWKYERENPHLMVTPAWWWEILCSVCGKKSTYDLIRMTLLRVQP